MAEPAEPITAETVAHTPVLYVAPLLALGLMPGEMVALGVWMQHMA